MTTERCTVGPDAVTGERCGKPATYSFTRNGVTYHECAEHDLAAWGRDVEVDGDTHRLVPAHPPTRTTRPYVLVSRGKIVGYAEAVTPAVEARARRLRASVVKVER